MNTNQIVLVAIFLFFVTTQVIFAETEAGWSSVHEMRKAAQQEKNKKIYGSKVITNTEVPVSDQTPSENADTVTNKANDKSNVSERNVKGEGKNQIVPSATAPNYKPTAQSAGASIPPPSKALLEMKKKRNAARKAKAARVRGTPDVVGTAMPVRANTGRGYANQ